MGLLFIQKNITFDLVEHLPRLAKVLDLLTNIQIGCGVADGSLSSRGLHSEFCDSQDYKVYLFLLLVVYVLGAG